MKRIFVPVLVVVLIALVSPVSAAQAPEEILKAVVKIRAVVPNDAFTAATLGTEREGNGVVIDSKGHILTIGYLIIEAETIEVFGPEEKPIPATFVGYDHQTGFGILRTEKPLAVEPMKLGESSKVEEGEPVLVAGHGGSEAIQAARVLSRKEFAGYWEYLLENAIYTIPAYRNYGGAALIDRDGKLLGIGSLYTQLLIQGLGSIPCNIFVPIDLLKPIQKDLIEKGRPIKAPQPWLGINVEEAHGRVFITKVTPGGPAEKAGLQPGDLVLSVKGKKVESLADFYRKVWALGDSGVDVPLSVLQGIQIREITVHSADRHQFLKLKPKKMI
jgi:S1-C subfamily serine protease